MDPVADRPKSAELKQLLANDIAMSRKAVGDKAYNEAWDKSLIEGEKIRQAGIPTIRVSPDTAEAMLKGDGRFRTIAELAHEYGEDAVAQRTFDERITFGLRRGEQHPVYGYLELPESMRREVKNVPGFEMDQYGTVQMRLKASSNLA